MYYVNYINYFCVKHLIYGKFNRNPISHLKNLIEAFAISSTTKYSVDAKQ